MTPDPATLTDEEIRAFLAAIESGAVTLMAKVLPEQVYAGNVVYEASNGWKVVVFNDCDSFDYIDWIETPDGRVEEAFPESKAGSRDLGDETAVERYHPSSDEVLVKRWLFPGVFRLESKTFEFLFSVKNDGRCEAGEGENRCPRPLTPVERHQEWDEASYQIFRTMCDECRRLIFPEIFNPAGDVVT